MDLFEHVTQLYMYNKFPIFYSLQTRCTNVEWEGCGVNVETCERPDCGEAKGGMRMVVGWRRVGGPKKWEGGARPHAMKE